MGYSTYSCTMFSNTWVPVEEINKMEERDVGYGLIWMEGLWTNAEIEEKKHRKKKEKIT